jgi:hypothetical protein
MLIAAVEPHALVVLASDDPEAIVLDLVQPHRPGRRLLGFGRQAGRDETGGQNTHVWLLTEPATKLKSQATPYRFLTTWPDNGLGKDGAGRGPWERELDALPTLWWPICAKR